MEGAGADALELNIYYVPTRLDLSGSEVEQIYLDLVRGARAYCGAPQTTTSSRLQPALMASSSVR